MESYFEGSNCAFNAFRGSEVVVVLNYILM